MGVEVRLELDGPRGAITAAAFLDAAQDLLDLVARSTQDKAYWVVAELKTGSAIAQYEFHAPPEVAKAARAHLKVVLDGFDELTKTGAIPSGFSPAMVQKVDHLAGCVGRGGVQALRVCGRSAPNARLRSIEISSGIRQNTKDALRAVSRSLGSVRGKLDQIDVRNKHEVGLVDVDSGRGVRCEFDASLLERITIALLEEITAWGVVERNAAGQKIRMRIEDFAVVEARQPPIPIEQLIGIYADGDDDPRGSVEWVRSQRDR